MLNKIYKIIEDARNNIKQSDSMENINRTNSIDDELKYIDFRVKVLFEINNILKKNNQTFKEFFKSLNKDKIIYINNALIYIKRHERNETNYSLSISNKYNKFIILYRILSQQDLDLDKKNETIINFIKCYFNNDYIQDRLFEIKLKCLMMDESIINNCFRYVFDKKTNEKKIIGFYASIYYKQIVKPFFKDFIAIGNDESTLLKYDYDNGIYVKMLHEIDMIINETFPDKITNLYNHRKQLKDEIFRRCLKIDAAEINNNIDLINFKNGYYDINKDKLISHSPKIINTIQLKGEYNPKSLLKFKDSLFEYYLKSTFDKDVIPVVQEMIGYCISSHTEAQKMFILTGKGGNSKSQLAEIISGIFEQKHLTNISLHQLSKQEYLYELATSAFNICADIDSEYVKNTGIIKTLTGGAKNEGIMARTLYGKPFKINPKCKFMFSANDIPNSADKNISWYGRILFIPFYKKFRSSKGEIKDIGNKIITTELEIVSAWAIEGLKRLVKNDFNFSNSRSINKKMQEYKFQNDSVEHFINDFCIIDSNIKDYKNIDNDDKLFVPCAEFTEIYKMYCLETNDKPLGGAKLRDAIERNNIKMKYHTLYSSRYYEGIAWNKEYEDTLINYKRKLIEEKRSDNKVVELYGKFSIDSDKIEKEFINKNKTEKINKDIVSLRSGDKNGNNIITKKWNLNLENKSEVLGKIFIDEKENIFVPEFKNHEIYTTCLNNLHNKGNSLMLKCNYFKEIARIKQVKLQKT